jgi:hypothetical protein
MSPIRVRCKRQVERVTRCKYMHDRGGQVRRGWTCRGKVGDESKRGGGGGEEEGEDMEYHGRSSASGSRPASVRQWRRRRRCERISARVVCTVPSVGPSPRVLCLCLRSGLRHLYLLDPHLSQPTTHHLLPFTLPFPTCTVRLPCSLRRHLADQVAAPQRHHHQSPSTLASHALLSLHHTLDRSLHNRHHAPLVQHQQHQLVQLRVRGDDADLRQDRVRQQQ